MQLQNFYAQDVNGNIVPGAACTLYVSGTTTLATGLQDANGAAMANPFSASSIGLASFAAPQGVYDLQMVSGLLTSKIRIQFIDAEQVAADAATASAAAISAQESAEVAQAIILRFPEPSSTLPTLRADGSPLQIGDQASLLPDGKQYIYKSSGWEENDLSVFSDWGLSFGALASESEARIELSINNVDNTSDANKPVSTPQQTALNGKVSVATLASSSGSSGVGFSRPSLYASTISIDKILSHSSVNIWEFESFVTSKPDAGDPSTWDWTPALAAAGAAIAGSGPIPMATDGFVVIPSGIFKISSVDLGQRVGLYFQGGVIRPLDVTTSRPYLIKLGGFNRIYNLCIDMQYAMNYDTAVWCRGRYIDFMLPDIWTAKCAYTFGDPAWATDPALGTQGDSEITIIGGNTNWSITVGRLYGQNTIVTFDAGHKAYSLKQTLPDGDPRKAAWEAQVENTFINFGALLYLTGCYTGNYSNSAPNFLAEVQPVIEDIYYKNSYGRFIINDCHIETGFALYAAPSTYTPNDVSSYMLQMGACHGYIKAGTGYWIDSGNSNQKMNVNDCGFYGDLRANVVYALRSPTYINQQSFGNYSGDFTSCVLIGKPINYTNIKILNSTSSNQGFLPTPAKLIMPVIADSDIASGFIPSWYSTTSGSFAAQSPMRNPVIDISLSLTSGTATDSTDISVLVNGFQKDIASSVGASPRVQLQCPNLNTGDIIEVIVRQYQSRATDGSTANRLIITSNV